jgi:uncharacterized protein YbbK (DUF523 family)
MNSKFAVPNRRSDIMEKILISACLLGKFVRYNGSALSFESHILKQWEKQGRIVSICPEVEAGMNIPRRASEISGGDGIDVINGKALVFDKVGNNVTTHFLNGAELALLKCKKYNIGVALLTESSPSCGSQTIYDGRFIGKKIDGVGVTTALLQKSGVQVFSQFEISAANRALNSDG